MELLEGSLLERWCSLECVWPTQIVPYYKGYGFAFAALSGSVSLLNLRPITSFDLTFSFVVINAILSYAQQCYID